MLPLFCPTCHMSSALPEHPGRRLPATLHGVVFEIFTQSGTGPLVVKPATAVTSPQLSTLSAAMKASCGMSTLPNCRIFFLPSFCFSRSLRLRVMSPP